MTFLQLLHKNGIEFHKSNLFWLRLECQKCDGSQKLTVSLNIVTKYAECHRCGWKAKGRQLFIDLRLKAYHDIEIPVLEEAEERSTIQEFPPHCIEVWSNKQAKAYLHSRGLSKKEAERYAIYYCPEGHFAERLIVPVFNHRGHYCTFVSRTITDDIPKYKYPLHSQVSKLLYDYHRFFKRTNSIWLVEGIFDAIHCYPYAIATFGKNISDAQIQLLKISNFKEIYLMHDHEAWKETPEIWERNMKKLSRHFFTFEVKLPFSTPTEFSLKELKEMAYESQRL